MEPGRTHSIEVYRSPVERGVWLTLNEIGDLGRSAGRRSKLSDVDVPTFVDWMRERGHYVGWGWADLGLSDDEALELRVRWF